MTIPEAIEILTDWGVISEPQVDQDLLDSVKLGVEALKLIKTFQAGGTAPFPLRLPGETEGA